MFANSTFKKMTCFLLQGIFISQIIVSGCAEISFSNFTNTYAISGSVKVGNAPPVTASGQLILTAEDQGDTILYTHDYHASAVTLGTEEDYFFISENKNNKTLDLSGNTNTSIGIIWNLFGNFGNNSIESFYRITSEEVSNKQVDILNTTVPLSDDTIFYSSALELDIPVHKVVVPLYDEYNITTFFDTKYKVMMGYQIAFSDHRVYDGAIYRIRFTITETNLDLTFDKKFPFLLITGIVGGSISVLTISYIIYRKTVNPTTIMDGGMN